MTSLKKLTFLAITVSALLFPPEGAFGADGKDVDVTSAGVIGDGTTMNTITIQKAIDACAASGGGTIRFPAGNYLTGTIEIKSHVHLRLEKGATLLGSSDAKDYRNLDPLIDGLGHSLGYALIVAADADQVGIEGPGTVDGQGAKLKANQKPYTMRPFLVRWLRCSNVTVRNVHLVNPGAWTLNVFQSKHVTIEAVTIRSRDQGLLNNDGVNVDSSEDVNVRNCDVISGDDALVIKSTSRAYPCRNIVATDCQLSSDTNAIKLGTESIGGFENISISKCQVRKTTSAGISLYEVDGGELRNVTISDITLDGVAAAICIRRGARLNTFRQGDERRTAAGQLRDITIQNVSANNIEMIGVLINGIPNYPVEAVSLKNIQLELPGGGTEEASKITLPEKEAAYPESIMFGKAMPAYGVYARHVRGIKFENFQTTLVKPDARPAMVFVDVDDVTPANFASAPAKLR
jgi:polygalacturonase